MVLAEYRGCGVQELELLLHHHGLFRLIRNQFTRQKLIKPSDQDNQVNCLITRTSPEKHKTHRRQCKMSSSKKIDL
jgi:hypothetical protein